MNFWVKIVNRSFEYWVSGFQALKCLKFNFSVFLQCIMVQLSAASQRAQNSQSSISFVHEGAESGP